MVQVMEEDSCDFSFFFSLPLLLNPKWDVKTKQNKNKKHVKPRKIRKWHV